jgi:hypothetical protein
VGIIFVAMFESPLRGNSRSSDGQRLENSSFAAEFGDGIVDKTLFGEVFRWHFESQLTGLVESDV